MGDRVSRRAFLGTAAALAVAMEFPAAAAVIDPRPPTVDTSDPRKIAEDVWIIPDHRIWLVPNIGIILGRDSALVVDCGLGPANGEKVLALARQIAGPRRLLLTVTHFHPEHGYGAQVFRPDATIIYNRDQRAELQEKGDWLLDAFRKSQSPAASAALDGTEIVMPHFVYEGASAEIDLGGRIVELHNWGGSARQVGRADHRRIQAANPVRLSHLGAPPPDRSADPVFRVSGRVVSAIADPHRHNLGGHIAGRPLAPLAGRGLG
jgi:hypothetical protein